MSEGAEGGKEKGRIESGDGDMGDSGDKDVV